MTRGYIYILLNAAMPGYLKIGKTERSPENRAKELSCVTGVPSPFVVAYEILVRDCHEVERVLHEKLAKHRVSGQREFFSVPLKDAISLVSEIAVPYVAHGRKKQSIRETLAEVEELLRKLPERRD